MKLKNVLFYLFTVTFMCMEISAQNTNPEVTNVEHFYNSADGKITITYYLMDAEQDSVYLTMVVSSDGGFSWNYSSLSPHTSGDIRWVSVSSTATQKTITWIITPAIFFYYSIVCLVFNSQYHRSYIKIFL